MPFDQLGRPPADLVRIIALVAVAGPAVAALRSLSRVAGEPPKASAEVIGLRNSAAKIAWGFGRLFNLPEATILLRGLNREEPYWQRVLDYCANGCLQATLDEYHHILRESLGLIDKPFGDIVTEVAEATVEAVSLRTASLRPDDIRPRPNSVLANRDGPGMRIHFAVRFGDEKSEEEKSLIRSGQVRTAFNSPFWPFRPLTPRLRSDRRDSTSINIATLWSTGISHPTRWTWNSARAAFIVTRAMRYGRIWRRSMPGLESKAKRVTRGTRCFRMPSPERAPGASDLTPFWVFNAPGGAKIERHVPAFPLSKDQDRLEALRRSLAVYRMVFGQIRQDDLLDFLMKRFSESEIEKIAAELRIDLSPPESLPTHRISPKSKP